MNTRSEKEHRSSLLFCYQRDPAVSPLNPLAFSSTLADLAVSHIASTLNPELPTNAHTGPSVNGNCVSVVEVGEGKITDLLDEIADPGADLATVPLNASGLQSLKRAIERRKEAGGRTAGKPPYFRSHLVVTIRARGSVLVIVDLATPVPGHNSAAGDAEAHLAMSDFFSLLALKRKAAAASATHTGAAAAPSAPGKSSGVQASLATTGPASYNSIYRSNMLLRHLQPALEAPGGSCISFVASVSTVQRHLGESLRTAQLLRILGNLTHPPGRKVPPPTAATTGGNRSRRDASGFWGAQLETSRSLPHPHPRTQGTGAEGLQDDSPLPDLISSLAAEAADMLAFVKREIERSNTSDRDHGTAMIQN